MGAPTETMLGGLRFRQRPQDPDAAEALSERCRIGRTVAQVLLGRGLADPAAVEAFLAPKLAELTPPDAMADLEAAIEQLASAVRGQRRIVVFGDYDVDGTTSAAILADVLEALGGDVVALVANRFEGGYGLSDAALDRCLAARPSVLVTCDCGSSDHARIARAKAAGVSVVVVDHHLVPAEPLPADAFLNPNRPDCGHAYKGLASAGLAFVVGAVLRRRLEASLDLRPWLDLVALGTVADVAPLDGDNRRLVRSGLRFLRAHDARAGVQALRAIAKLRPGSFVGGGEIAFRLAPRLNAAGRLGDPAITLALLRERDPERARSIAAEIAGLNERRKAVEREVTEAAIAQASAVYGERPTTGIVVGGEGWHRGVLGITAARLVDRFGVPAIVLGIDAGSAEGSGRTRGGFDLHAALVRCRGDLGRFGGHAAAVGLSLAPDRVDVLRAAFSEATRDFAVAPETKIVDAILASPEDVPTIADLDALEPLGERNPIPRFVARGRMREAKAVGEGDRHLKLDLDLGGRRLGAFAPDMGPRAASLTGDVVVMGTLRPDDWRGGEAIEMLVEEAERE